MGAKGIRSLWQRIETIGLDAETNPHDAQRIRVTNVTNAVGLAGTALTAVATGPEVYTAGAIYALIALLTFALQKYRYPTAAALTLIGLTTLLIAIHFKGLGSTLGVHFWLLPLLTFPALLLPRDARVLQVAVGSGIMVMFWWLAREYQLSEGHGEAYLIAQCLTATFLLSLSQITRAHLARVEEETRGHITQLDANTREMQRLNAQLTSKLDEERDLSRLKEAFLASLSHELRTPLNAVMGLSEALREEVYGPLTEGQDESLKTVWESGAKLLAMFDDLLDFSRIGAGALPTTVGLVNLQDTLRLVVSQYGRAATEAGVEIVVEPADFNTEVLTDQRHLIRILSKLLDNAIKFSPKGESVTVTLTDDAAREGVQIAITDRKCSTSYIQRKLAIGYNKAARLVEQMEDEGVVSPANHVGKREILVPEQ